MTTAYEIVKRHYEASDRKDMPGMLADIAPDCRWTEMDGFPCAGTYVGPDEIFEGVFKALGELFDGFAFTLETLLDAGDNAVGIGRYTATAKATGKSFSARVAHVWTVRDGKVVAFEQFTDTLRVAESLR